MTLADLAVVLVRTEGPVNLGMIARACANLGVNDLRLVAPRCERNHPDARKFANHAIPLMESATIYNDVAAAVADRDLVYATTARRRDDELGEPIDVRTAAARWRSSAAQRPAIIFGNEADGLADAELRHAGTHVHLPTPGDYPSYNLSHAVVVSLAGLHDHLRDQPEPAPLNDPLANRDEVDRLGRYWLGSLERFRYFRRTPLEQWKPRFESMLRRWDLTEHDCVVVRGMLAQMNYVAFGDKAHAMDETGRAPADDDESCAND